MFSTQGHDQTSTWAHGAVLGDGRGEEGQRLAGAVGEAQPVQLLQHAACHGRPRGDRQVLLQREWKMI